MTTLDWPEPTPATLEYARRAVDEQLASAKAAEKIAAFYQPSGDYAGLTFHTLPPTASADPADDDLSVSDLLAITLLEVAATPRAVRHLLEDGAPRTRVLDALAAVPTTIDLVSATDDQLAAAVELYRALKAGLGGVNRWVAASKLAARKRPALIPVRDSVVVKLLRLPNTDERQDWLVFRHLLADPDLVAHLRALGAEATTTYGAPDLTTVPELRLLDTLLWMRPAKPRTKRRRGVGAAP